LKVGSKSSGGKLAGTARSASANKPSKPVKATRVAKPSPARAKLPATVVAPQNVTPVAGDRRLKVLFVASEVAPFRKTGGLADVAGVLPRALRDRGVDIRVVMPLYQGIPWSSLERLEGTLSVPMYYGSARAGLRLGKFPGSELPNLLHRVQPLLRSTTPLRAPRASLLGQPGTVFLLLAGRA